MRIFLLATAADWRAAQVTGRYTTATRGRTLAEEGFVHASRGDQWQEVRLRHYADVTEPLVLLVVDTDLLDVPVVEEPTPGGTETFPHVYGAVATTAVVSVVPLDGAPDAASPTADGPPPSFSSLFLGEVFHRVLLAGLVMTAAAVGAVLGRTTATGWGPLLGTLAGVVVGVPVAVLVHRRRERQVDASSPRPG